jgi:hypothetical protein
MRIPKERLEAMDRRFAVQVGFTGGATTIELVPKRPVQVTLQVHEPFAADARERLSRLFEHGEAIELPTDRLSIVGSPLIEHIASDGIAVELSPTVRHPALLKGSLISPEGGEVCSLDDMTGTITTGSKSATFTGFGFGGFVSFKIRLPLPWSGKANDWVGQTTLQFHFESWRGKSARSVPYLDKLLDFLSPLAEGYQFDFALEMNGESLVRGSSTSHVPNQAIWSAHAWTRFLRNARDICRTLDVDVTVPSDPALTHEDVTRVEHLWHLLVDLPRQSPVTSEMSFTFTASGSMAETQGLSDTVDWSAGQSFLIRAPLAEPAEVLGQSLNIETLEIVYSSALLRPCAPGAKVLEGRPTKMRILPTSECRVSVFPIRSTR